MPRPAVLVFSALYPNPARPLAGVFIRERMLRVAKRLPVVVVSPQPWFPMQGVLRLWKKNYRPSSPYYEKQAGLEIYRPRFLSFPGFAKSFDGYLMALGAWRTVALLKKQGRADVLDAHFAYPSGFAATVLGRILKLPVTITLRGTVVRHIKDANLRPRLMQALKRADRVFAVAGALCEVAYSLGISSKKTRVVGNGVDAKVFQPVSRSVARAALDIPSTAKVLITVGGLVERKGFHRVIATLPALLETYPNLIYLIVGGASAEGDFSPHLHAEVQRLGLEAHVRFLGPLPAAELKVPLSAADVFVLSTRNEGWANVFLEALACGRPVVSTLVGGNAEVIEEGVVGSLVPFGDEAALLAAIEAALLRNWDEVALRAYAMGHSWEDRAKLLCEEFKALVERHRAGRAESTSSRGPSA